MRSSRKLLIPLFLTCILIALPAAALAESTRTLKGELPGTGLFAIENLAGTMRVTAGSGDTVTAVVTVHAESDEVAGLMSFEKVSGKDGVPTLRVIYPLDRYTTFRYPGDGDSDSWIGRLFGWAGHTQTRYAGKQVKVSPGSGILLYADVEVQLPRRRVEGSFINHVGDLFGQGVQGRLKFDGSSGEVTLEDLEGDIVADTGSGDVKAADIQGSFLADTGSGDISLSDFRGESIDCDTGSGDIHVIASSARKFAADTGSGNISATLSGLEHFEADTGSGDVELETDGSSLTSVKADTGSGDVLLRLGPDASFEAHASLGSGDIVSRYKDAEPILQKRELVGYRRGDAKARIVVDTGSGDFILEPGR